LCFCLARPAALSRTGTPRAFIGKPTLFSAAFFGSLCQAAN
jgi:hypothetical protein